MGANNIRLENYSQQKLHLRNLNEVNEESKELYIYHILPLEYFIKMIDSRSLFLSQICTSWEDPYELWGLAHNEESNEIRKCFYGQSWSTSRDSDALWRIYSPNKLGVRIKSSIQKLCNSIALEDKEYTISLGRVSYKTKGELSSKFKNPETNNWKTDILESLFLKRNNFSHESEVRLILKSKNRYDTQLWRLNIDPADIVYEVYFDPRLDDSYAKFLINALNLKIPKITVSKSPLYKNPKIK